MVGVYEVGRWGWTGRSAVPTDKNTKRLNIHVISDGITRLPILEGEISHIEIPRGPTTLGITIVGGADTPLRCVVVQEVFPDGLVAQDGRLQPGDQIIEVDGVDMTSATHQVVCQALRRPQTVLRLGVYRERIEAYRAASPQSTSAPPHHQGEMVAVTLCKETSRQLGLKLGGRRTEPGIFVMEVLDGSVAAQDGQLHPHDRILAINGADVRYARLDHASRLIQQSHTHVSLVVSRGPAVAFVSGSDTTAHSPEYWRNSSATDSEFHGSAGHRSASDSGCGAMEYGRSASCDSLSDHSLVSSMMSSPSTRLPSEAGGGVGSPSRGGSPTTSSPGYCTSDTDDTESSHHHPPTHHHHHHHRHSTSVDSQHYHHQLPADPTQEQDLRDQHPSSSEHSLHHDSISLPATPRGARSPEDSLDIMAGLKRLMHTENNQLQQKNVTIKKIVRESLGMRIGGGVNSNEGDTPIYIANINPQGPVGRCRNIKKGDVLLSVNGQSLLGLTHGQAVALLKATAELIGVTLSLLDGPETSVGSANFVPSWLYWQKLPRSLHISKSVVLHRAPGASLGFSIVGGSDPQRGAEPIHVLFVVQSSPAALEGKLRCGDRLLSVDGHSLELVRHASAVSLLKQAGQRVNLEVVSWLGTEL
ncbi:ligand of Numb protein X 2 [Procambarus clarkii]|uniref:ligand of Numb protein X 2 n=1 Tax=Procambarus clarkii TaxID=6728 RepID=UPI001E67182F|nr:ligand of Numb protein X 2-like [Procambarus clarkii]XP_045605612.1 ligand of Numb protein X 2-like [Procambarus clarkii]